MSGFCLISDREHGNGGPSKAHCRVKRKGPRQLSTTAGDDQQPRDTGTSGGKQGEEGISVLSAIERSNRAPTERRLSGLSVRGLLFQVESK